MGKIIGAGLVSLMVITNESKEGEAECIIMLEDNKVE